MYVDSMAGRRHALTLRSKVRGQVTGLSNELPAGVCRSTRLYNTILLIFYAHAGFCGENTLHKTVSTTFFLYFACILPAIAFGVLNYNNTGGQIGPSQCIDIRPRRPASVSGLLVPFSVRSVGLSVGNESVLWKNG